MGRRGWDSVIGIIYPAPRTVAYSSLFYRQIRNRLMHDRVYGGSWFLENRDIISSTRRSPHVMKGIFVSLPYEVMYRDYLEAILRMGLSPHRKQASDDVIIVAGGPAVTANPLPIFRYVDAVLIGEIEDIYYDIINIINSNLNKNNRLRKLAEIPGMLVPGISEFPVKRHYVKDINKNILSYSQDIPNDAEPVWGRSYAIESSRGCGRGCRFCMEGFIFRPKRDRSFSIMKELINHSLNEGFNKISFYSLSFFDNPYAEKILEEALNLGLKASIPSVRADTLTEKRLELIGLLGQKTLTIAPETGSCRVCRAINKHIEPDTIVWIADLMPIYELKSIKMYIITGFPLESEEDFNATLDLIEKTSNILRRKGLRLKLSVNPFMPKPVTPLQWAPLADKIIYNNRLRKIKKIISKNKNIILSSYDYRWASIQTAISRGGEELADLLLEWARQGSGIGHFRRAARITSTNIDSYIGEIKDKVPRWHSYITHPYASVEKLYREYKLYSLFMRNKV